MSHSSCYSRHTHRGVFCCHLCADTGMFATKVSYSLSENRKCCCFNTTQAFATAGLQRMNLSHCLSASWEPYAALCLYPACLSCLSSAELHHYRYHCLVDRFRICLCLFAAHPLPDLQRSPEIVNTILSRLHLCLLLSLVMYCALQAVIIIMSKHSTPTAWLTSNASTTVFGF